MSSARLPGPLRVAMVTMGDASLRSTWSGTPFYMARALEREGAQVRRIGPGRSLTDLGMRAWSRFQRAARGRSWPVEHRLRRARALGRGFSRAVARSGCDVVLAPAGSQILAFLDTTLPVAYSSDATIDSLVGYYPGFRNLPSDYVREADELEARAIRRADLLLYPSDWAAESARTRYAAPPERIHVLPYGANLDEPPPPEAVRGAERLDGAPTFLFLGVEWERKGGDLVLETLRRLRERGVPARLVVCGCLPPRPVPEWVQVIPRLDKTIAAERARLHELLASSAFLFVPSRQECFGIVYCEASAYGTPSVAADTGGVGSAVDDGVNGMLLPAGAGPDAYAERIREVLEAPGRYAALVRSTRRSFDERLSWKAWGSRVVPLLERLGARGSA